MIKKIKNSQSKQRRGTALVEMALVLPLCLMIMLAIIEIGRAMTVKQILSNAAFTGARLASTDGSSNFGVKELIASQLQDSLGLDADSIDVSITVIPSDEGSGTISNVSDAERGDLCTIVVNILFDDVSYVPRYYLKGKNISGQSAIHHQ